MKFIVASGELQKALNVVSGVISSSQSRPILENFLFELENEILKITASDGETTLITSLAVKSDDQGKIAVPAKIFQDLIKTFGDQPLTFSVKDSESGEGGLLEILDEKDNYASFWSSCRCAKQYLVCNKQRFSKTCDDGSSFPIYRKRNQFRIYRFSQISGV